MTSLSDVEIKNLPIEKINEILNSGKYIPAMKKKTLIDRKKMLNSKNFSGIEENEFPSLGGKKQTVNKENNVWAKGVSDKVKDNSNVPEIKKKDILKNQNQKKKVVKQEVIYSSEEEFYNHDDDYY